MNLLLASYATVFVAELLGDKTMIAVAAMASRKQRVTLFALGLIPAFMLKMGVAVLLGSFIRGLSPRVIACVSAASFFLMALVLWRKGSRTAAEKREGWRSIVAAFGAIFFSEWGDAGQLAAATLVARYDAPLTVWVAATLAMITKAAVAVLLGFSLGRRLSSPALRYLPAAACAMMGALCLFGVS
jgi:putative Ca2+/H+ antiporter (TMEM165/GDT1 family)